MQNNPQYPEPKPGNFILGENIDFNKTAISSDLKLLLADRYYLKIKHPVILIPFLRARRINGTDDEEYINKMRSLKASYSR